MPRKTAKKASASLTVEEKQALADATAATKAVAKEKKRLADAARKRATYIPKDRAPKPKKTEEELRAMKKAAQQARRAAQQHAAGLRAAQELLDLQVAAPRPAFAPQ